MQIYRRVGVILGVGWLAAPQLLACGGSNAGEVAITNDSDGGNVGGDGGVIGVDHADAGESDGGATTLTKTTKTALQANDTSASVLFRDDYTPAGRFFGAHIGVVTNGDRPQESVAATSFADGSVSKVSMRSLLPTGSTAKIFFETQSWFCTNGTSPLSSALGDDQCGSHIDIGYSVNTTAQIQRQVADMLSRGGDGIVVDWEGTSAGNGALDTKSTSSTAINTGSLFGFKTAAEASGGKFTFAAMEDEGAKSSAAAHGGDWTQGVLADIAFLSTSFFGSPAYLHSNGHPVLFVFGVDDQATKAGATVDWATVKASAPGSPLLIFENATHDNADGAYAWPKPTAIGAYPGGDPFDQLAYLPNYYTQETAKKYGDSYGVAFKGFDDHAVNGWVSMPSTPNPTFVNGERYIGQQCGKTWLDSFKTAGANVSTLAGIQVATWDDYEEATEVETGIDNHLTVTPKVNGSALTWTLNIAADAPVDCTQAVASGFEIGDTVHHFAIYASPAGDGENLSLIADDLSPATRSFDLTGKLGAGSWKLYVRAVAQPSITNQLSSTVTFP